MEKTGGPSRWNTLRAMRVLKHFGETKWKKLFLGSAILNPCFLFLKRLTLRGADLGYAGRKCGFGQRLEFSEAAWRAKPPSRARPRWAIT
jgi:hypothetical protein